MAMQSVVFLCDSWAYGIRDGEHFTIKILIFVLFYFSILYSFVNQQLNIYFY